MTRRITLPGTGLSVSALCLGGNRLGADLNRDASFALLDAFVAAGGNFIDTAHVYADWLPDVERSCSEKTLGRWREARGVGASVVVATKIGHPRLDRPGSRLDRDSLRQDVAEAQENLRQERLDLVYLHRDDPTRDAAEILAVLEELRSEGRIAHYAASNWTSARLTESSLAAQDHGWQGFVANQPEWSLATRNPGTAAADLVAMDAMMTGWHRDHGIAAIPYSAQARGYFDKLEYGTLDAVAAKHYDSPANRAKAARLGALARSEGITPTQAMLALFAQAPFPVIPVVGCHTAEQIAASFAGIDHHPLDPAGPGMLLADLGLR
jgi:aryl-alcohol dehydrogenase-like predicted oxidoreductase